MPIVTTHEKSPTEFSSFVVHMAQLNPSGFRQPGRRPGSTSLPELAMLGAGEVKLHELRPERSERSRWRRRMAELTRERVRVDQAQGLELRRNTMHGRNRRRHMRYIGLMTGYRQLVGQTAIVWLHPGRETVLAQFDERELVHPKTFKKLGYDKHEFHISDFEDAA
ncbi:gp12 [Alphaproteobacteria phage PhiJL001]|uniref:Gp12 n=1 Tax=Alphaproteobacteria phage PhiJL001 TaxID=2681607 RepID=Q5DN93_9CAUD|nr:gp12 [Alphaproteobacteria phage PhiJL001]AAT69488.1 gp12 [Alphaproteobacteria phage PhiJL001]